MVLLVELVLIPSEMNYIICVKMYKVTVWNLLLFSVSFLKANRESGLDCQLVT